MLDITTRRRHSTAGSAVGQPCWQVFKGKLVRPFFSPQLSIEFFHFDKSFTFLLMYHALLRIVRHAKASDAVMYVPLHSLPLYAY
jgi:hypothetical protein